jgi:hypothetical protein
LNSLLKVEGPPPLEVAKTIWEKPPSESVDLNSLDPSLEELVKGVNRSTGVWTGCVAAAIFNVLVV